MLQTLLKLKLKLLSNSVNSRRDESMLYFLVAIIVLSFLGVFVILRKLYRRLAPSWKKLAPSWKKLELYGRLAPFSKSLEIITKIFAYKNHKKPQEWLSMVNILTRKEKTKW